MLETTEIETTDDSDSDSDSDDDDDSDSSSDSDESTETPIETTESPEETTESPIMTSDEVDLDDFEGDDDLDEAMNGDEVMDRFHPQSVANGDNGELMVSLSPSTIANLWAVTGLLLLVNITFCLYRVCRADSKTRYFSESDHYESQIPEEMEFQD